MNNTSASGQFFSSGMGLNRFDHTHGMRQDLKTLEFVNDQDKQRASIDRLMDFDHDYGLTRNELAVFEVLLKEFHERLEHGLRIYRPEEDE